MHGADVVSLEKRYDGTRESLQNKSSRPHTPHPNAHTKEEQEYIRKLFEEQPNISYAEALGILRQKYAYSRTYYGFYRYVVKSGIRPKEQLEKYEPQPYETPEMFGIKMQMDVKYVPKECFRGAAQERYEASGARFYQYTMIDETTRERFLYPYTEVSARATADFVKRAIVYFGYLPHIIQTDNGGEFTNSKGCKKYTSWTSFSASCGSNISLSDLIRHVITGKWRDHTAPTGRTFTGL